MDCNKRTYSLDHIISKIETGEALEHCEELFYLVHHHHIPEEDAERLLYRSAAKRKPGNTADSAERGRKR